MGTISLSISPNLWTSAFVCVMQGPVVWHLSMGCRMEEREFTNPKIANCKVQPNIQVAMERIITWIYISKVINMFLKVALMGTTS